VKLEEIKNNPELMNQLRWDLTPQTIEAQSDQATTTVASQEELDQLNAELIDNAGAYFIVDVWNCTAKLALMIQDVFGNRNIIKIGKFDSPLLEESVYDDGGAINRSGIHPINSDLEKELKKKLKLPLQ